MRNDLPIVKWRTRVRRLWRRGNSPEDIAHKLRCSTELVRLQLVTWGVLADETEDIMSIPAINWCIEQSGMNPSHWVVLFHLCHAHNQENGCYPSHTFLAEQTGMSKRSIVRHIASLEYAGKLRRKKRFNQHGERLSDGYAFPFEKERFASFEEPSAKLACGGENRPSANLSRDRSCIDQVPTEVENMHGLSPKHGVTGKEQENNKTDLFSDKPESQKPDQTSDLIEEGFEEFWNEIWPRHKRKTGKVDCRKVYEQACRGKHPKAEKIAPADLNAATRRYIASVKDREYLKAPLAWLRLPGWEPFLGQSDPQKPMTYAQKVLAAQKTGSLV